MNINCKFCIFHEQLEDYSRCNHKTDVVLPCMFGDMPVYRRKGYESVYQAEYHKWSVIKKDTAHRPEMFKDFEGREALYFPNSDVIYLAPKEKKECKQ